MEDKVKAKLQKMEKKAKVLKSISEGILRKMRKKGTDSDVLKMARFRALKDSVNSNVPLSPSRGQANRLYGFSKRRDRVLTKELPPNSAEPSFLPKIRQTGSRAMSSSNF